MISFLSTSTEIAFRYVAKPILFALPPDFIHEPALSVGKISSKIPGIPQLFETIYAYSNPFLEQKLHGIYFPNPIGLAAGYDYKAALTQISFSLGFGWQTVGSITALPYDGNQPPMFGRLPQSQSLWVNKGFKNPGIDAIVEQTKGQIYKIPVGLSIGATNRQYNSLEELITEYQIAFEKSKALRNITYYELNISCPNLSVTVDWTDPKLLQKLLKMADAQNLKLPVFIKMPVDISDEKLIELLKVIRQHQITGIIIGNLTKKRQNPAVWQVEARKLPAHGGLSGKPTQKLSDHLIKLAYQTAGNELMIIGCGGIFSAKDAYRKIRNGASVLQLITGMIYGGPQVIGQINRDLVKLLKRDGFTHLSEAIGVDA